MMRPAPKHNTTHTLSDFTPQISEKLKSARPYVSGSFGDVYRFTIETSKGTTEVAVKVLNINPRRAVEKYEKALRRELKVWLRLSEHRAIVPLLGTANVGSPCLALVLQWMPSETLCMYLEKQGITTASARAKLVRGVADGLGYLHSENVVHGDLHPANVLIDDAGNPRLTDFGLATIVGDAESQLNTTTANRNFNPQWRAPEVIGIGPEAELVQPNFKSDIYAFGGIMFFILSGDKPWKEKKISAQIIIELWKKATPARSNNILDDHWNLIQKCWSWNPDDRPEATEVIRCLVTEIIPNLGRAEMPECTIQTIPPEIAESTFLPPTTTARVKHGTISSFDTTILPDYSHRRSSLDSSSPFDDSPDDAQDGFPGAFPRDDSNDSDITEGSRVVRSTGIPEHERRQSTPTPPPPPPPPGMNNRHHSYHIPVTNLGQLPLHGTAWNNHSTQMASGLTRNIVIFGETGVGKSSVINLMAGKQIAHISPDSYRCTLHWTEYPITFENGTRYKVFDTVGLEEPRLQTKDYLIAISNAYGLINLLKERGGIDLLLFCIRGTRVTATMQNNYRLFFEFLCEEEVPLVLVVTNLEREVNMEDWYTRNVSHLERHNIRSAGHACITARILLDGRHREKYEESRGILRRAVEAHCNASMEGWTGGQGWLSSFISKLVEFVIGRPKKTDIIGILTKRCGMTKEVARQVAQHIKDENQS